MPYDSCRWRRSARCQGASRNASCSRRCCAARTRCCCSTSRTTTSTCRASSGWRSGCASPPRPSCWSRTIGSCSTGPPSGSSPWSRATCGSTAAGSPRTREARSDRNDRLDELRRRWDEEHAKLKQLVLTLRQKAAYNDGMASRYQAALTRLARFEEAGPPERRRGTRTSGCGCAAAAPANARSSASSWN